MILPNDLKMKETQHGSGANGLAFYIYEDCAGLGVVMEARRGNRHSRFLESWRFRWLPDQTFATYGGLRAAIAAASEEAIAVEKAKWPQLHTIEESTSNNSCWLHRDRPATHRGMIATCWIRSCIDIALLCQQCTEESRTDAGVIERAVQRRRADVAARKGARAALAQEQS